jgi:hypothetical protein
VQSMSSHFTSWRSILILSSYLRLCLPSDLLPSGFPTKPLYTPLLFLIYTTCTAHLILDLITWTILVKQYRSLSSSLCSFLHSPVTSFLLGPHIPLALSNESLLKNAFFQWFILNVVSLKFRKSGSAGVCVCVCVCAIIYLLCRCVCNNISPVPVCVCNNISPVPVCVCAIIYLLCRCVCVCVQ